jgi:predicted acylesterase/phospholipase RssA
MEEYEPRYKYLVLSGGSIQGIAHIGAIKKLVERKLIDLNKLKGLAGTSCGSIIGMLVILGFSIDEIWDFVYCLDIKKLFNPNIMLLFDNLGVDHGLIIYNLIEDILTAKTKVPKINFEQLYQITKVHFIVVGTCLTTKTAIYYDHLNTPMFEVSKAIRISISMPGFFVPVTIDGNQYIDGGIMDNYPIGVFSDKLDETIGILISHNYDTHYQFLDQYIMAVFNLYMYLIYEKNIHTYQKNTIYVKCSTNIASLFNFNIDNRTKVEIYNLGINACEEFIKKIFGENNNV